MKKTTTLSSIATAVAIVSVMASCQNKETTTTAKKSETAVVSNEEKIVYVNSDSLLT